MGETAQALLQRMRHCGLIRTADWDVLPSATQQSVLDIAERDGLLSALVEQDVLTPFQATRIQGRSLHGGVLVGNYRLLDHLSGSDGELLVKAEHCSLDQIVALKLVSVQTPVDRAALAPLYAAFRIAARLRHRNLAAARDAGQVVAVAPAAGELHYFVRDFIPGPDLCSYVRERGPLEPGRACDLVYQIAGALSQAHEHDLVHGTLSPSKICLPDDGQAILLDLGFHWQRPGQRRQPDCYDAPEQRGDDGAFDTRTDIYRLGGILFWCLTGRTPLTEEELSTEDINFRSPPLLRSIRPDSSAELEQFLTRLLAASPGERFQALAEVRRALLAILKQTSHLRDDTTAVPNMDALTELLHGAADTAKAEAAAQSPNGRHQKRETGPQILLVDDEPDVRRFCRHALLIEGLACDEATSGLQALDAFQAKRYDLVLLDNDMPEMTGIEVCQQLRKNPPDPRLKIIMFSGRLSSDELAQLLLNGADDYLTKPVTAIQLQARVKAALRLKDAQERSDQLNRHLLTVNRELERHLSARDSDLIHARNALVLALAKLVEYRDTETGAHLLRLQTYSRCLAETAAHLPAYAGQIDPNFIEMVACCAPLHDIGKVGLPDHILLKPSKLEPEERLIMQSHTIIGAETLQEVARQHAFSLVFLQMATEIARHHHERYDGQGYPDRLAGTDIPLSARLVAVCDVYDALRSRRSYKPSMSHNATMELMLTSFGSQFDPHLLPAFETCAPEFERIFSEVKD